MQLFHISTAQPGQNEKLLPARVSVVAQVAIERHLPARVSVVAQVVIVKVVIEAKHVIDEPPGRGGTHLGHATCIVIEQSHRTREHGRPRERAYARLSKAAS